MQSGSLFVTGCVSCRLYRAEGGGDQRQQGDRNQNDCQDTSKNFRLRIHREYLLVVIILYCSIGEEKVNSVTGKSRGEKEKSPGKPERNTEKTIDIE